MNLDVLNATHLLLQVAFNERRLVPVDLEVLHLGLHHLDVCCLLSTVDTDGVEGLDIARGRENVVKLFLELARLWK